MIDWFDLPNLTTFNTEWYSFQKQQVWVWIVWWYMIDWFDLPNLTTFNTGYDSFYETTSLSLESMMIYDWLIWSS